MTFGVVLAIGGTSVLIFFIHHIASSIQASSIIASVADETMVRRRPALPGDDLETGQRDGDDEATPLPPQGRSWQAVPAQGNGYVESVDMEALLRLAREHSTVVRMERGIGEFVVHGTALAWLDLEDRPRRGDRCRPAGGLQHPAPSHGGTGLGFRHPTDRGHGFTCTLARNQRHHDGGDVRGLSDGDSGAAGLPTNPFAAPLRGGGTEGHHHRAKLCQPGG